MQLKIMDIENIAVIHDASCWAKLLLPMFTVKTRNVKGMQVKTKGRQEKSAGCCSFSEINWNFTEIACHSVVNGKNVMSVDRIVSTYSTCGTILRVVHWKQNIDFQSRKHWDLLHKPRCFLDWKSIFCFQWTETTRYFKEIPRMSGHGVVGSLTIFGMF